MRAVPLKELRDLLQGQPFASWWTAYAAAVEAERAAAAAHDQVSGRQRLADLEAEAAQRQAIDTFSAAGEAQEAVARVSAEAQAHEVRALEQVGHFEEQRFRTSDLWYRLGGAERTLEIRREAQARVTGAGTEADRLRQQAESAVKLAERQVRALQDEYAGEDRKRSRLWDEVEAAWDRSFERSLLAAEHGLRSRRILRDSEQLFREAEEKRLAARQLRDEAEQAGKAVAEATRRRAGLLEEARERFGCVSGESFLYWRHPDDQRAAWAVALRGDGSGENLPVKPLEVYTVSQARGVAFLEPAREGLPLSVDRGDRRFEDYFLGPRHGARREGEASPASPEVERK